MKRALIAALVGVDLVVDLPHTVSVDADLPYIAAHPDAPSHDLQKGLVAEIATDAEHGTRSTIAGRPHPRCEESP